MKARWAAGMALVAAVWLAAAAQAQNFQRLVFAEDISGAFDMALFDMDGDHDVDAAATSMWGSAYLIETLPDHRETTLLWGSVSGLVRGIAVGDLDADGDSDLVVAAYGDDRFVRFENTGASGSNRFVEHTLLGNSNGAWSVETGDFDSDGDVDLVVTEYLGNRVKVLENHEGVFSIAASSLVREPFGAVFADFDADGDSDVVCCSLVDPLYWVEQESSGVWTLRSLGFGAETTSLALHDFGRDGDLDIAGAQYANGRVIWWERAGSGFTERVLSGSVSNPRGLGVTDFDGNGHADVIVCGQYGDVRWWRNDGNNVFTGEWLTDGQALYGLDIADADQDGDPDVVMADYLGSELLFYKNMMVVPAILRGTVRSAQDDEPLAGVEITVNELGTRTYSDEQGTFQLWTAEGTYSVAARHSCWNEGVLTGVTLASTETTTVEFALDRGIMNLEITSLNLAVPNREVTTARIPVSNSGDGALSIRAQAEGSYANDEWLTVLPEETTIPPGEEAIFEVTIAPDTTDDGLWDYFGFIEFHAHACPDSVSSVAVLVTVLDAAEPQGGVPETIALGEAYPNPFNGSTAISLRLPRATEVTADLFDVSGRHVRSLLQGTLPAGTHAIPFAADGLGSGVYFVRLQAGGEPFVRKVMLVR
ncbi:MAG: FG-GAP-like repeat-containing protein [bacterium]|nr:FG-GAP-like repeat-containing protein [bacterium]